jgi:hypothetical protein
VSGWVRLGGVEPRRLAVEVAAVVAGVVGVGLVGQAGVPDQPPAILGVSQADDRPGPPTDGMTSEHRAGEHR